jgi:hypothetical protein
MIDMPDDLRGLFGAHLPKKANQPQTSKEPPLFQTGNKKYPENAGDTPSKRNDSAPPGIEKSSRFLTFRGLNAFSLLAFRS